MKVFNKGQIVIPAAVRRKLKIEIGDMLDFFIDEKENCIKLKKPDEMQSTRLAGSLSKYNRRKRFPTRQEMRKALAEGLMTNEK
jgi:AbrB family looped-hinge helix DNA binding protein